MSFVFPFLGVPRREILGLHTPMIHHGKINLKHTADTAAQLFMMQAGILSPVTMATLWYGKKDVS